MAARKWIKFDDIIQAALEYVEQDQIDEGMIHGMATINAIVLNPGLERGCPAMQKFCKGYESLGVTDLKTESMYAWHGTGSAFNIISICHNGFDTSLRRRQLVGVGEYFGTTARDSYAYSSVTSHLILVQVLTGSHITFLPNICIVANPEDMESSYTLPLLMVSFGYRSIEPILLKREPKQPVPYPVFVQPFMKPAWHMGWHMVENDGILLRVPTIDVEVAIWGRRRPERCGDVEPETDNEPMCNCVSPNSSVRWERGSEYKSDWSWRSECIFVPFPLEVNTIVDRHYRFHAQKLGPPLCGIKIVGESELGTQSIMIDYRTMIMTNVTTGYQRRIQRRRDEPKPPIELSFIKKLMLMFKRKKTATSVPPKNPALGYGTMDTTKNGEGRENGPSPKRPAIQKTRANQSTTTRTSQSSPSTQQIGTSTSRANGKRLSGIADVNSGVNTSTGSDSDPPRACCCGQCIKAFWRWFCCR